MNVSLVICTYNRADSLRVTLGSLADLRVPSDLQWEVLVVDNNSSDHTREVVDAAASRVPVRYDHGDAWKEVEMLPSGANMALRRAVFTKYGPFNTDLGPVGHRLAVGEDSEFCQRIRDGGEVILYVPDAIVYHPVVPARARKQYFQSWYYRYGKWDVRREPPPREASRWFGIPRWLFRSLASETVRWLTTTEPRKRFFHKASCYFVVGAMVECYRLTHRTE